MNECFMGLIQLAHQHTYLCTQMQTNKQAHNKIEVKQNKQHNQ
jgi:hypothetical protein